MPQNLNSHFVGSYSRLLIEIDDWCFTPPRKFPLPPKPQFLRDQIITVIIQNLAAELSDAKIGEQIQNIAGKAFLESARKLAS